MEKALIFLAAAYAVTWAILFLYLIFLGRQAKKVEKEIKHLKEIIESSS